MKSEKNENSYETGREVWESLASQFEEGRGFMGGALNSFRTYIRKHIFTYLLFGFICAAIAAGAWFLNPKLYEANMTVSYVQYEKKIYADMLEKLDILVEASDYQLLSEILDMPEESVESIHSITSYNIRREALVDDLGTEKVPFYITIQVDDPEILIPLEEALVNYLNSTDFIRERIEYMQARSTEELVFLQQRLAIIDSLSNMLVLSGIEKDNEKSLKRMELLEETIAIHDKIQEVKGTLMFNYNIEILDGIVPPGKMVSKGLVHWIFYGFLIGLAIRWVSIVFKK